MPGSWPESPRQLAAAAQWLALACDHPGAALPKPPTILRERLARHGVDPSRWDSPTYVAAFEVGRGGPPAPLRESAYVSDGAAVLRRIVAFYTTYGLATEPSHPADHLCVELAFVAYLAALAATFPEREDLSEALVAFVMQHPARWVSNVAKRLTAIRSPYAPLLACVVEFLQEFGPST